MRDGERRVVVTGMGALTPIGNDVPAFWDGLVNGRSGIDRITLFDPVEGRQQGRRRDQGLRRRHRHAEEGGPSQRPLRPLRVGGRRRGDARRRPRRTRSTDEALAWRTGAIIGSGIGGINTMIRDVVEATEFGVERIGPFLVTAMIPDMAAGYVAIYANARGPNYATVSACSSANHAIGDALNIIRRGDADVMIAGGAEAGIGEIPVAAFSAMRALSTKRNDEPEKASRPFDAERDGFVMGDGAGMLVLEALEHARARGATIHAEVVGYGATDDASHITLPAPGGRGAVESMRVAIADAGLTTEDIDYINAHGTSTPPNDRSETAAIKTLFGERAYKVPISSTKSMTGHLMGAGGGIEAIASIRAIKTGIIPPTINLDNPDPDCDLDYVPHEARQAEVTVGMSNSFGFGGHNATLVFRRYDGLMARARPGPRARSTCSHRPSSRPDLDELEIEVGDLRVRLARPKAAPRHFRLRPCHQRRPARPDRLPRGDGHDPFGEPAPGMRFVSAPLTGVWYSAPSPGARPYVTEGDEIASGQVVGLIEAMKLFNEIKSDASGTVTRILVEPGTLVKRKQPLLEVDPR